MTNYYKYLTIYNSWLQYVAVGCYEDTANKIKWAQLTSVTSSVIG